MTRRLTLDQIEVLSLRAAMLPPNRCAWTRDADGEEWLIPGCMGAAALGPENCTCGIPESRIERAELLAAERARTIEKMRARMSALRAELQDALDDRFQALKRLRERDGQ